MRRFSTFPPRAPHNRRFAFNPGAAATSLLPLPPTHSSLGTQVDSERHFLRDTRRREGEREGGEQSDFVFVPPPTPVCRLSVRPSCRPTSLPTQKCPRCVRRPPPPFLPLLEEWVRTRREGQRGCLLPSLLTVESAKWRVWATETALGNEEASIADATDADGEEK